MITRIFSGGHCHGGILHTVGQKQALAAVAEPDFCADSMLIAKRLGSGPTDILSRDDTCHFFERLDDVIRSGLTRTNVDNSIFLFGL